MNRLAIWAILSLALTLRLALLLAADARHGQVFTPDSTDYLRTADTLAWHGRFAQSPDAAAELVRTPGYPLLLATAMRLTGQRSTAAEMREPSPGPAQRLTLLLQALLDMALVGLTYALGVKLCGRNAGLLAAVLQAVSTAALVSAGRVLTDGVFAFLLTGSLLCLVALLQRGRLWAALAGGVLLAASTYVRPAGLLLAVGLMAMLALWPRRQREGLPGRRPALHLKAALLFGGAFVACVAPWMVRNALAGGYPRFSAIPAVNLYEYEAVAVRAHRAGVSEQSMRQRARLERQVQVGHLAPAQQYAWMTQQARQTLREHPGLTVYLHLRGDLANLLPAETDLLELLGVTAGQRGTLDVLKRDGLWPAVRHYFGGDWRPALLVAPGVLLLGLKYLGVVLAAAAYLRPRAAWAFWIALLVVLYCLLIPGPAGHPRFRVPVTPLLNVAAAAGWLWLARRRADHSRSSR